MAVQKIRIKLAAYEHELVDEAAMRIVETEEERGEDLGTHSPSHRKGDRHHPPLPAQRQGFPRTV